MVDDQVRELMMRGFDSRVVDTSGRVTNLPACKVRVSRILRFIKVVWGALWGIQGSDAVILIVAPYSAFPLASFFWAFCKITSRPLIVRVSAAGLRSVYLKYGVLTRWLADRTYMRSSRVYVETEQLQREFGNRSNFRWFPNTRDLKPNRIDRRDRIIKIIFLSRLDMAKGLGEALEACRDLPEECQLNVFGPAMSDTDFSLFENHPRAAYGGVLAPADVPRVLSEHDLMLFPSYMGLAEGYPGSIIEAFQCGIPVVAARFGGVSELVEHEKSGLLIEPRSADAVREAIERLLKDINLYQRLCEGAKQRGEFLRSDKWYDRMASDLHRMCWK